MREEFELIIKLIIICSSVVALIGTGYWLEKNRKNGKNSWKPNNAKAILTLILGFIFFTMIFSVILSASAFAAEVPEAATGAATGNSIGLGLIAAGLSTGLACIGAGIAVAFVGAAALGVVGEKPDFLGKTLIYVGLAEGIAIYGIIISILILFR